ncbi:MAG: phage recombination protein Bet [Clostridiales bacterium]
MNKNEIMKIETDSGEVKLSLEIVRNQIAKGKDISDAEIHNFMQLCFYRKLNPFLGQAHLIKFKDKVQMVVGKDVFTERLNKNPLCEGWESGLILYDKSDKKVIERVGTFFLPNEELVGAYCIIERSGWKKEFKWTVRLSDYFRTYYKDGKTLPMGLWGTMPGVMITKCCTVAAVRNVFPEEFGGMYEASELGIEEKLLKDAIDVTPNETQPKEQTQPKELEPITSAQLTLLCASAKSKDEAIAKSYQPDALLDFVMTKLYNNGFLESPSKKEIPKNIFDKVLAEVKKTVIQKENDWNKKNGIKRTEEKTSEEFKSIDELEKEEGLPLPEDKTAKPANTKAKEKDKAKGDKKNATK